MTSRNLLRFVYSKINPKTQMASVETVQNLECLAQKAEKNIEILKSEITDVQKLVSDWKNSISSSQMKQYEELKYENNMLRKEIEEWKNKLIETESKLKILQVDVSASLKERNTLEELTKKDEQNEKTLKSASTEIDDSNKKAKQTAVGKKNVKSSVTAPVDVGRLDIRIGKIVSVKKHEDADSLYIEEVDVGEEKPRTVVSGLVKFVPIGELENRMVVLVCNLKPAKIKGVLSEAMVLCASTPDKVEVLKPPENAVPGDKVIVEGYDSNADSTATKKIFESVAPDLKTDDGKIATYKGVPFIVPDKGMVTASTLANVSIK